MSEVFERVRAISTVIEFLPADPDPGSPFAVDAEHEVIPTYMTVRRLLLDGLYGLQAATRIAKELPLLSRQGSHVILLRPALVSLAKAAWIVNRDDSAERIKRAVAIAAADQFQGARAMGKAVAAGAPDVFASVRDSFEASRSAMLSSVGSLGGDTGQKLPSEERLIKELAIDIDRYYGTSCAESDLQLLWNASSCLAHGERWYCSLTKHQEVAEIMTDRSLDAVCSGLNATALRAALLTAATQPDR